MKARHVAHGLGINDNDIIDIEDWSVNQIHKTIDDVKKELIRLAEDGIQSFVFIYATGHGEKDSKQSMVLNGTSGNMYPIEQTCEDICTATSSMCKVFAMYNLIYNDKPSASNIVIPFPRSRSLSFESPSPKLRKSV